MAEIHLGMQTVLIVNDDNVTRMVMRAIFEQRGWLVYEADNGTSACDFLHSSGVVIHWIILDITMPIMDGYQFLGWFIQSGYTAKVAVLTADVTVDKDALMRGYGGVVKCVWTAPPQPSNMFRDIDQHVA